MGRKFTYDFVKRYIEELGYILLENEYKGNGAKMKIQCDKGHEFEMRFSQLYNRGRKCPRCGGTAKKRIEDIQEYIESQNYELLSTEYIKATSKLKMKCDKGHEFEMSWNNFKNHGQRCPSCMRKNQKYKTYSYEYVKEYIENSGYELISKEYKGCKESITVKCPKHGEWTCTFDNFKNADSRCPKCKNSKGENEVSRILNQLGVKYINKYKFADCKYKRVLEFDFYLEDYNTVIEYDGEFHYAVTNRNSKEDFVLQQKRDMIKNEYCHKNNIKMIRIPYWDFDNIENILHRELKL